MVEIEEKNIKGIKIHKQRIPVLVRREIWENMLKYIDKIFPWEVKK